MTFHTHPISSAEVGVDELPVGVERLGKAIQSTVRRLSNLLKGDHYFWIPERQPVWDSSWDMHPVDTVYFVKSRRWDVAELERLQPMLLQHPTVGRLTAVRWSDSVIDLQMTFNFADNGTIAFYQRPKTSSVTAVGEFWTLIASTLGITELYEPNEKGPHFRERTQSDHAPAIEFKAESYRNELQLKGFSSLAESMAWFCKVSTRLNEALMPQMFALTMQPRAANVPALIDECRRQNSEWSTEFFGKYRRKFDPYATPKNPDGSGFYPVLQCTPDGEFMEVQVSVEHANGKSWLVLHSEAGEDLLRKVIEEAGLEATYNS